MVKGLYMAYTGMTNEQKRLDVITNNLANADTTAYKKEGTTSRSFGDELAYRIKDTSSYGMIRPVGEITWGAHLGQTYTNYDSGSFKITDNPTDFAINGKGFFAFSFTDKQGNTSVKYGRDGSFTVNTQGYLVTKDGDYVLNMTGALNSDPNEANYIRLDPTQDFEVDQLGVIYQNDVAVGTIGVIDIDNYDYISKYGENMYDLVEGGNVVATDSTVQQGALETSNVNVIDEMVDMITIQRAYEAGQKVITSIDSTLDKAVNTVGRAK